ncbi:MAG: alpha-1,6-glucosidase domain-containing protein [Silanimonas sp.]
MLLRPAVLLAALLAATPVIALTPLDTRPDECAAPGGVTVHAPWPSDAPAHQQAAWIDATHLRWKAPSSARTVLLTSTESPVDAPRVGAPLSPGLRTLAIERLDQPPAVDARFSHVVGDVFKLAHGLPPGDWSRTLHVVALDASGRVLDATGIQYAGALDAVFAANARSAALGARIDGDATRFALWAPTATSVTLCVFDDRATPEAAAKPGDPRALSMRMDPVSGVWSHTIDTDLRGARYAFLVDVVVPGVGRVRNRVTDPYALGLNADSRESVVLDLDDPATKPEGWADDRRPDTVQGNTDLVVYELHVRDFSRDDATVPEAHRGRYLAFTHPDTAGMRHLRALAESGLTDVHLLPTYDLASVPERDCAVPALPQGEGPAGTGVQAAIGAVRERDCYNWGYDPWHFDVPEGSYATNADDAAARVREFRAMVQALHQAGLRVGLDVVYNHTMASGQDRQSVLDRIVPGYYHRLDADGAVETSTCCANTATEATMMAKLMVDSAVIWARDYRIDSFRFDLMGHQPKAAMLELQRAVDAAAGRRIHLLGEGWNFGEVQNGARFPQAAQGVLNGSGIATFSDRMRDAARGGRAGDRGEALHAQGWLSGLHHAPNAANAARPRAETVTELRAAEALVRVGLAGTLVDFETFDTDGVVKPLREFRYGDGPAGYASQPGEVVNYTENHDNLTLFDSNALRLPLDTSRRERARVQVLGNALVLLAQGVAYLHAGQELMRSKSLDRNSYNSGDAFNVVDWTGERSAFGTGLPPAWDNEDSWPQMRPVLERVADIAPRAEDAAFVNAWTKSLLRIRRDSPLLRLDTREAVQAALRFLPVDGEPGVVVGHLDGGRLPSTHPAHGSGELVYVLNTDPAARTLALDTLRGGVWHPHPALETLGAAASLGGNGRLSIPGRGVAVFVR